jgi:hypothetical protein
MAPVMGQTEFPRGDDPPITPRRSAWRLREPFCHPLGPGLRPALAAGTGLVGRGRAIRSGRPSAGRRGGLASRALASRSTRHARPAPQPGRAPRPNAPRRNPTEEAG